MNFDTALKALLQKYVGCADSCTDAEQYISLFVQDASQILKDQAFGAQELDSFRRKTSEIAAAAYRSYAGDGYDPEKAMEEALRFAANCATDLVVTRMIKAHLN